MTEGQVRTRLTESDKAKRALRCGAAVGRNS